MLKVIYATLIVTGVLIIARTATSDTQGEELKEVFVHDFGDRIVTFAIRTSALQTKAGTATISDAKLIKLGERYFVTGKLWVPESTPERKYQHGTTAGLAWEDVRLFYAFDKAEQFEKFLAGQQEEAE